MDERARIPVSLPREHPTTPFWQDPPDVTVADLRSSPELPPVVDVVIVGSGITGTSIAYHLLELGESGETTATSAPLPSILMLEARQVCSGATGRNGGHTKAASYRSFMDHVAAQGVDEAVRIARLELGAIQSVHGLAAPTAMSKGIDCDSNPCDTLDVLYDPAQWARAQEAIAEMRAAMPAGDPAAEYTLYSRDEALAAFPCSDDVDVGSDGKFTATHPICGVVRYTAGSVSAYRFTAGVLKQCLARGLNLQANTPVLSVAKAAPGSGGTNRWAVKTDRGIVSARHVVLATNGYTAHLVPVLQGVVVPLRGQIAMHRAGSNMPGTSIASSGAESLSSGGLSTTYSFIYEQGYEYMITRPPGSTCAGDVVIGGGLKYADPTAAGGLCEYGSTDDTTLNPIVSTYLRETPLRYFGQSSSTDPNSGHGWGADHPDGRVRAEWTGIMGYTPDGYPLVGEMPPTSNNERNNGLWLCCAFQGHGMVYAWPCGRALASMIQADELDNETARKNVDTALQKWFPSCFRTTGARLRLRFAGRLH
ncbi:hypothetical protein SCUCBS95973_001842 [Sporothrix curviconia]|uniref:FAD dependent oxidoreductase domain-containing protein n=1 Tax=Sporothrix curviconia TaxID=1260050 RepID=A0ABP0B231_9PEZI